MRIFLIYQIQTAQKRSERMTRMTFLRKRLRSYWDAIIRYLKNDYRPELHYMRGPGPKYREMYRTPVSAK